MTRVVLEVADGSDQAAKGFKVVSVEIYPLHQAPNEDITPDILKAIWSAVEEAKLESDAIGAAVILLRFRLIGQVRAHCLMHHHVKSASVTLDLGKVDWRKLLEENECVCNKCIRKRVAA